MARRRPKSKPIGAGDNRSEQAREARLANRYRLGTLRWSELPPAIQARLRRGGKERAADG